MKTKILIYNNRGERELVETLFDEVDGYHILRPENAQKPGWCPKKVTLP